MKKILLYGTLQIIALDIKMILRHDKIEHVRLLSEVKEQLEKEKYDLIIFDYSNFEVLIPLIKLIQQIYQTPILPFQSKSC